MLEERHDQHYLRRPGDLAVRRTRARRGLARRMLSLALQAGALTLIVLVGRQAYLYCITAPAFAVRTIAVRGNHHASTAEILALASSVLSENVFRADLGRLRADLIRSPWILDVSLRRALPDTIEVQVEERVPAAIVCFEGATYLIDRTGRRLAEYGPAVAEFDFPILTGIEGLPRADAIRRIKSGAAAIGAFTAAAPDLARRVSSIDLSLADRIALHLADGSPILYLDTQDYLRNLDNYSAIRALIQKSLPGAQDGDPVAIAYVDLRFRGRIAVMPKSPDESAPDR